MRFLPAILSAAVATTAAAGLAGCGGSSSAASTNPLHPTVTVTVTRSSPGAGTAASTATSTATSTASGTTTGATTTTTATTATTADTACSSADLHARFVGSNGATGNFILDFSVTNVGTTPCHTYGWPGVAFTAGGHALPITVRRTSEDLLGSTPALALVIAPGGQASFRVVAPDADASGGTSGCSRATGVQIIAPDDSVPLPVTTGAGVTVCGTASVSPLLSGGSASPGV